MTSPTSTLSNKSARGVLVDPQLRTMATNCYTVRFSTRGRVTIPAALRRMHGIKGGSRVVCEVTPAGILLKPIATKRR
jgi:AbrB family looped-hinge helix DNA binding protein